MAAASAVESAPVAATGRGTQLSCRIARDNDELAAHHALRRAVFVAEQGLFTADDRDARDEEPGTLRVVGLVNGSVCGVVRLYPLGANGRLWKGDRLAIASGRRANALGAMLVQFAVRTAGERGGERMIAHIQLPNVPFFEHLGWTSEGEPEPFHGLAHQLMAIPLVTATDSALPSAS